MIITINGSPGSGKSTVGKLLAAKLDIPFISMGEIRRQYALAHGITIADVNAHAENQENDISDAETDEFQRMLPNQYPSFVLDSRLGFHFLPHTIKINIAVTPEEGARRIFGEHRIVEHWGTVEQTMRALQEREQKDRERFQRLYHIDTKEGPYDLVLDSSNSTPEEVVEKILTYLEKHEKHL